VCTHPTLLTVTPVHTVLDTVLSVVIRQGRLSLITTIRSRVGWTVRRLRTGSHRAVLYTARTHRITWKPFEYSNLSVPALIRGHCSVVNTPQWRMWKSEQPPDASSFPPGHWQMFAALWTYCPQLTTRGPPPCCRCGDPVAASRLEATNRTLALHLPGGRQLFVTTGGALWTQQRSSGVIKEKRS